MFLTRQLLIRFGGLLVTVLLIIFIITKYFPNPLESIVTLTFSQSVQSSDPLTIHLVHVIKGTPTFARSVTFLKSLFYYQGRIKSSQEECRLARTLSTQSCTQRRTPPRTPIHLHLIVERKMFPEVKSLCSQWKVSNFTWTLYDLNVYLPQVQWIPNRHYAGAVAVIKMLVPEILPTSVKKVIVLDTDILLNANILDLWTQFNKFNRSQIFGLAWEPDARHANCGEAPIPAKGVNSGVILMHLSRMRVARWRDLFEWAVRDTLYRYGSLYVGEQTALNTLIRNKPEIYYQIPCEWNTQLWSNDVQQCCPVIWIDRLPEEPVCANWKPARFETSRQVKLPNLIHYDAGRDKPESGASLPTSLLSKVDMSKPQTRDELRARFLEAYWRFKHVLINCFE